jgi:hypothetical protein
MCVSIYIFIWLNKKLILIKKFSKHNRVNILMYTYFLIFSILFLVIVNNIFLIY